MEREVPNATQEEFNKRVIHYQDAPVRESTPGQTSHVVSSKKMTVLFATFKPNSPFPIHRHESEQICVVTSGTMDMVVEGKLYHLKKDDVIVIPSNVEHADNSDTGCTAIEIFSPARQDILASLKR